MNPMKTIDGSTQRIRCRIKYFLGLAAIVPFAIVVGKRSHASAVFNKYVIQCPTFRNHPDEMCGDLWLPTEKGNFRVSDFGMVGLAKATLSQTKVFVSGIGSARSRRPARCEPFPALNYVTLESAGRGQCFCGHFWRSPKPSRAYVVFVI